MRKLIILMLSFLAYNDANAFNWAKCKRFLNRDNSLTGAAGFASTTSFFSSTGECAMIGRADHDSKVFIVHNFDHMKVDFARGRGEYVMAFASMYGCNRAGQLLFPILIKSKFNEINRCGQDLEVIHKILVDEIQNDPLMISDCSNRKKS